MSSLPPQQPFKPGAAVVPASQVEISVSCRKLRDKDAFSKSDPMCVMYAKQLGHDQFYEFGRTEMIKDTLNPDFVKKFLMNFMFEESQKVRFELYDVDSGSARLDKHDFLGRLDCTLGEIVGAPSNRLDRPLTGLKGNNGTITIRAEEIANCKEVITMQFRGTKLDKKDLFGKSDPFLTFSRSNEDGSYTVVHKTEVIKNTLNPTWRPFLIKGRVLCNGDHDRSIKVECYDWDSDGGSHDLIGVFTTTLRALTKGPDSSNDYEVIHPKKKAKKKSYKHSGKVALLLCKVETEHTFLDYIQGGTELNFTVAVDFTASNGNPTSPTSLHFNNPYQPNLYARALQAVGEIIQDYDSDKMFPALGFGARIPPTGAVSHEFFLNGSADNPYCQGIEGIMAAYHRTLQTVQLYGPTNFSPVIRHMARFAQQYNDGSHYFVLLILTDGVITDMPHTKEAIVNASGLPMSIIIIGIGDADFSAMEELDADDKRLYAAGHYAERDIVQFVPFRDFVGGKYGNNLQLSQAYLAKEVLAEVPDQITGFMKTRGINPSPASSKPKPGPGHSAAIAAASAPPPAASSAPPPAAAPQGQPPPGQYAPPPAGQYAPPAGQYAPPAGQYAPPAGQYARPAGQYPPPSGGQYAPPAGQYPPGQYAPPPGQYAPPAGQYQAPGGGQYPPQQQGQYPAPGYAPPGQQPPPGASAPRQY